MSERVQMSRQHPWRADHPYAVIVARPSKWGNPFAYRGRLRGEKGLATRSREYLVNDYRAWLTCSDGNVHFHGVPIAGRPTLTEIVAELAGKDLACWCPLDQPCHADVLLALANGGQ